MTDSTTPKRCKAARCPNLEPGYTSKACTRHLDGIHPHGGWCMAGHRFGRPRTIWSPLYQSENFHWTYRPYHYHGNMPRGSSPWLPLEPVPSSEGKDVWQCSGCELRVEMPADASVYGANAALMRANTQENCTP